jgi:cytosine/adenosine deaminase-related metal-dependent hydrolase
MSTLSHPVRSGDRVTIRTAQGQEQTGRVNGLLITRGSHCVLNMGGKYGRPAVASDANIVAINGRRVYATPAPSRSAERAAEASWLEGMGV